LWPLAKRIYGQSDAPILVGPFLGEVGFEALYWLPFLHHLRESLGIARERIIPITRGGAALWYDAPTGVELFEMRTPQAVRVENRLRQQESGMLKQTHVRPFDREIYRDAAETLGLTSYQTLHPSWMYQTLRPFWDGETGLAWLQQRMRFQGFPQLGIEGITLPDHFIAVRFYFRATFGRTPVNVEFAEHCIRTIAKHTPVVVLNTPDVIDDHLDYVPKGLENVTVLSDLAALTPANNLAIQSAVLQRASGFVGTYGGMAQLALRMGKPSISVYDQWHGTAWPHRHLSDALAVQMGTSFHVVAVNDIPAFQAVMPTVVRS
jgi:hypothetical protein